MILVDSSVWIDYIRGTPTAQVEKLEALLGKQALGIGDLNLIEVLQGFRSELEFNQIRKRLALIPLVVLGGPDVAVEAADVTLLRDDLGTVVDAIMLSRATLSKIRQNLFFAFAYNVLGIPLAAFGLLNPVIAGAAMAASSVSVVGNALLLSRWRPPQ